MKNPSGTLRILKEEDKIETYYDIVSEENANVLLPYKDILIKRCIKKFNNKNWFEFGLKRNE